MKILVLGATGYVGGRLVPRLLKRGYEVRVAGRSLVKMKTRPWANHPNVDFVLADVFDSYSLEKACENIDVVYYLVHSMNMRGRDFSDRDRVAAANMRQAASKANVKRIIYLGGLGEQSSALSKHLASRREVEHVLRQGTVPVTVFRAAMIIGSGSASFEILRYLVNHLPVMITPRWVFTLNQPIAIGNVLTYLVECVCKEETIGQSFDIGGPDQLTYEQLMQIFAQEAGLSKRWIFPVPVLTPRLSSYWIHFITPVPASIARPLVEGLRNQVICQDNRIQQIIPQELLSCREAIARAIKLVLDNQVVTYWTDAGEVTTEAQVLEGDPDWAGGTMVMDRREIKIEASVKDVWNVVTRIGGETGWYHANFLWMLRGVLDRMVGGFGLRRGRRDPVEIVTGDVIDFWRVITVEPNQKLTLKAEMKLPGIALLSFVLIPNEDQQCTLYQIARFRPKGLWGVIYWTMVIPLHEYVFSGMAQKIKQISEENIQKKSLCD